MLARALANLLIFLGAVLLLVTAGMIGYSEYEGQRVRADIVQAASATPAPTRDHELVEAAADLQLPALPVTRVVLPSIQVDTSVVESPIVNGEWQVPRFVAGHLEGTALPGQMSNVVLTGHLQSLTNGNVFADLERLRPGDAVSVYTEGREWRYTVRDSKLVLPNQVGVVGPTPDETLTLVTCAGTWNPFTRMYSHRIIVTATLSTT